METKAVIINTNAINELIAIRRDNYLRDPRQIVSDYNNENKNIDDYNGRQLLEMIQNANDESDTNSKSKKVFIKLETKTLLVANNGNPFSKGGVESLMYSDMSPKTMEENKVGKKGLGFRSILNWSEEIYIASYDLHLKFSEHHARLFLDSIIEEQPNTVEVLKEKTKKEYPIAILRCPFIEENTALKKLPQYDTVIELSLKDGIYENISEQIDKDIIPEILIFLNKLEEIEVETKEVHFKFKKTFDSQCNQVVIYKEDYKNPHHNQKWIWNILEDKGVLEGKTENKNYELKIAYNPENEITQPKLFSYFRTEIDFPYPVLAHGSFELKADRNQLARDENDFNFQLLEKLAALLIKCAITSTENTVCSYNALKIVVPQIGNTAQINQHPWGFNDYLDKQLADAPLFPTIEDKYVKLTEDVKFYVVDIASLIPKNIVSDFKELLKHTNDSAIQSYLRNRDGSMVYKDDVLTEKLNVQIENNALSTDNKVDWIFAICTQYQSVYKSNYVALPNLLIDKDDKPIIYGSEAITPPEGSSYEMPSRIKFAFINPNQFSKLKRKFGNISTRELLEKVKRFSVTEYALNVAVQKIISGTEDIIEEKQELEGELLVEMHTALFGIYNNIKEGSEVKNQYPTAAKSPNLYTKKGTLKRANQVYFDSDYVEGKLMSSLLVGNDIDAFVSLPERIIGQLNENETQNFSSYLKWIGVATRPRKLDLKLQAHKYTKDDFINSTIKSLSYPYSIQNFNDVVNEISEFNAFFGFSCTVLWYEFLDEILENASIEAIITWFLKEQELFNCIVTNTEPASSSLKFNIPNKQYSRTLRNVDLKSYIKYKINLIAFIPVGNGKKVKISEVLLDSSNLLPLIAKPEIIYENEIFINNGIDRERVIFLLKRFGIKESLADVSLNELYGYLLNHDSVFEQDSKNVQNFYTSLIEATKNKNLEVGGLSNRDKYFEIGKIYTKKDDLVTFIPVQQATYVDNPNFSRDLLKKLHRATLPMRAGNKRMATLFNVQPLDYIKFKVEKPFNDIESINESFVNELNLLKPSLFMYRHSKGLKQSQSDDELRALKKLQVQTCKEANVSYVLNDRQETLQMYDYEFIQDELSTTFYIKVPNSVQSYEELKKDFRFKETVADVICGVLKVSENRKDFMLLLGEDKNGWDQVLSREFDNYLALEKDIAEKFDGALTIEEKFWDVLFETTNIDRDITILENRENVFKHLNLDIQLSEFLSLCRDFDFGSLSKFENVPFLITLFTSLEVDIIIFNANGYKSINIIPYWENRLRTYHTTFQNKLKSFYFRNKDSSGYSNNNLNEPVMTKNSVYFDYELAHKETYTKLLGKEIYDEVLESEILDINKIYNEKLF